MSRRAMNGNKSVRSIDANMVDFLEKPMSITEFRQHLLDGLYQDRDKFETYRLTEDEWRKVLDLRDEKYGNWDWNFGKSPAFIFRGLIGFLLARLIFASMFRTGISKT